MGRLAHLNCFLILKTKGQNGSNDPYKFTYIPTPLTEQSEKIHFLRHKCYDIACWLFRVKAKNRTIDNKHLANKVMPQLSWPDNMVICRQKLYYYMHRCIVHSSSFSIGNTLFLLEENSKKYEFIHANFHLFWYF